MTPDHSAHARSLLCTACLVWKACLVDKWNGELTEVRRDFRRQAVVSNSCTLRIEAYSKLPVTILTIVWNGFGPY